ncbi:hypothetical protein AEB_P1783 [Altererythrobacter sp. B11]|uniref:hypothetical protein n=1 Tax=Altererythrobacter sp. B11 TaxID=2060312 RepID=UPI000DC728C0|nr:hypothetical protein [Altererythrobacter sp. B11]BBC72651.1 hypothetical protein AEB_P1783 [Altererythrobacter sp. B11]
MKDATTNAGQIRNDTPKPPRSHDEALSIIRKARQRLGKRDIRRIPAQQLVRDNLTVITELRDRGHRQEDAVLLILEVSSDAHKADTVRKAIRAVVGDWVMSGVDSVTASQSVVPRADQEQVGVRNEPTIADDNEGGLVL